MTPSTDQSVKRLARMALCTALALSSLTGATVRAEEDGESTERAPRVVMPPLYKQECAACHVAYPPGMLPVASWQRLMSHLPKHFGTDASLDPAVVKQLSTWLSTNAGTQRGAQAQPPQDRITRTDWFIRQHDEVGAAVWQRPAIKSPSNCVACHTRADQGDFNERFVRIPR